MAAPCLGQRKENWTSLWKTSTAPAVTPPATGLQRAARSSQAGRSPVKRVPGNHEPGQVGPRKSFVLKIRSLITMSLKTRPLVTMSLENGKQHGPWLPCHWKNQVPGKQHGPWLPCHWKTRSLVTMSLENRSLVTVSLENRALYTMSLENQVPGYHVTGKPGP
jgi:hypothetical protein